MPPNEHQPPSRERGVSATLGPQPLPPYPAPLREVDEEIQKLLTDPSLLAHLCDVVVVLDRALRLRYLSRTARAPACSLIGRSILDLVAEEDRPQMRRTLERALHGREPGTLVARDLEGRFWESRLVPTQDHALLFMASTDVTEQKRAEQALAERETRLRSAVESSGVGTWNWDCARDEVVWDAGLYRIYGLSEGLVPESYVDYLALVHPDDRALVEHQVEKCLATGVYGEFEHRLVRPDGEVRHVLCRGSTVLDDHGVVVAMQGGVFDVTDQKRLEEQLRHVQKMEVVGQLTAGIAHNFNNLLSVALPNVELCRARAPAELHGLLDDVLHATDRAIELVRQLMRFARQDLESRPVSTDLGTLSQHTAKICRATFDRRIEIAVHAQPGLPPVSVRPGEIEQVLLNICINARDALDEARTRDPRITVSVERASETMVRAAISDNGPGMDERTRARLFEPFFTTKEISKGTGLGLASAYATVVEHGGRIRCESTKGAGSRFIVELPIAEQPPEQASRPAPTLPSRGSERVLLVDDEALVRRALRGVLEQAGFVVVEAADGGEGLARLDEYRDAIDVIVLDRSMPRMSGEQFLVQLGERAAQHPVVLLSGHASADVELPGVAAVMMKPPRGSELLRVLRSVLDGRAG